MEQREISRKGKIAYIVMVCVVVLLLWLADESTRPIVYQGGSLNHTVGLLDSDNTLVIRESVARTGVIASTPELVVNKGTYKVSLAYDTDTDGSVLELWEQGSKIAGWSIDKAAVETAYEFTLSKDAKQLQFKINYCGEGSLNVRRLEFSPRTLFYTDTYYIIAVFLLCNLLLGYLYKRSLQKGISREKLTDWCVILGVTLLAMSPMFQTYLYNGDDLCYHLARMEGVKDGILDGQIGVNILPDGMKGNGYLNAMYPYLFLYIGAFLRICRVSIALSYKSIIFAATLGSAVCAYYAVKSITDSRRSIILAVVLYTLMPYRFTNIFSRGDLGETLALTFWPLVIAGLYHVTIGNRKKWYLLVLGVSGILQSHILSAAFAVVLCILTALLYCVQIWKEKRYVEIGKAAGLILLLNAWYVVPFCYYYFAEDIMKDVLRWSGYFEQSINLSTMTQSISLYNKQYFSMGLALLGCLGIGIVYLVCEGNNCKDGNPEGSNQEENRQQRGFLVYLLVLGCLMVLMCTGYFPNRKMVDNEFLESIVTMIQFPWRFLGPASCCLMFVGVIGLSRSEILKPYRNIIFGLLIGLNLLVILWVPADNNHMPYTNAQAVASKGHESKLAANIGLFYPHEWRLEGAAEEKLTASVVNSDVNYVEISQYVKKGTKAAITYRATEEGDYIELPIQAYLGYRAKDETGQPVEIIRGDGARIRFLVKADGQEHTIYVRYGPVIGFVLADMLSALTLLLIGWRCVRHRSHPEKLS